MCGRYALTSPPALLRARFGYDETPDFPPRANILPTEPIAIVAARAVHGGRRAQLPACALGLSAGLRQGRRELPAHRQRPRRKRAGEGELRAGVQAPPLSRPRRRLLHRPLAARRRGSQAADGAPFGLAALYETYLDANGGEIDTACILTTAANALLSPFGDRMPAIIAPRRLRLARQRGDAARRGAGDAAAGARRALLRLAP